MPFVARYFSGTCANCGKAMNPGENLTVAGRGRPSRNGTGKRTYRHVDCGRPMTPMQGPQTPPAIRREALPTVADVVEAPPEIPVDNSELAAIRAEIAEMKADTARQIAEAKRAAVKSIVLNVNNGDRTHTIDVGIQHENFPMLCELMAGLDPADRNVWLTGPAGSGKTTAARKLAEALGLGDRFYFVGAIDSPYKLTGFVDAQGKYNATAFYQAVKFGGVFLFDEVDGSLPGAVLEFQAFLATGYATFPDDPNPVQRHPECYIVAAANTWGFGGDANYVGRMKLDAAFLDRFVTLEWNYDDKLERVLAGHDVWVGVVQAVRTAAMSASVQVVISPRASMKGAQLLRSGMTPANAVKAIFGRYRGHNQWASFGAAAERFAAAGAVNPAPANPTPTPAGTVNTRDSFAMQPEISRLSVFEQNRILDAYVEGNKIKATRLMQNAAGIGLAEARNIITRGWGQA